MSGRGHRDGQLTKHALRERLLSSFPDVERTPSLSLKELLGHAIFHGVVNEKEIEETTPRNESVVPCYLHTYVRHAEHRRKLEEYVQVSSRLYRRGTIILNLHAQRRCGQRLPGASDSSVSIRRPQYHVGKISDEMKTLVEELEPDGVRAESNTMKQAFLPERWPSRDVPRRQEIDELIRNATTPPCPADWLSVMSGHVSGWDNAINRMMTRFLGNVKVHTTANLPREVRKYLWNVPLTTVLWADQEGGSHVPRDVLTDAVFSPLRPILVSTDDWEMAMDLRTALMGPGENVTENKRQWFIRGYAPSTVTYSKDVLRLHLFLCVNGVSDRSLLPVANRGRHYTYVDSKIAKHLLAITHEEPTSNGDSTSRSFGELLGISPKEFNATRRSLRKNIRRKKSRCPGHLTRADPKKLKRAMKDRKRWRNIGSSKMNPGARVDSIETDGVGLRIVIKTKESMSDYCKPVGSPRAKAKPKTVKMKSKKNKSPMDASHSSHPGAFVSGTASPIFAALDEGRAKPFSASISQVAYKKPTSIAFHRARYYSEMGLKSRQRWEEEIVAMNPELKSAIEALSVTGGIKNCDHSCWERYLATEGTHRSVLDREYYGNVERSRWTMRMFRSKKKSLDGASQRLLTSATFADGKRLPIDRPLIVGVGNAVFPSCGPHGELPAPTSQLARALVHALKREQRLGRLVQTHTLDEFRTTMCCSSCGTVSVRPTVRKVKRNRDGVVTTKDGPSCRLRQCTDVQCNPDGKFRDRDVQGSRNLLWILVAKYYGSSRPEYLCRPGSTG